MSRVPLLWFFALLLSACSIKEDSKTQQLKLYKQKLEEFSLANPERASEVAKMAISYSLSNKIIDTSVLPFYSYYLDYLLEREKAENTKAWLDKLFTFLGESNHLETQIVYNFLNAKYYQSLQEADSADYYFTRVIIPELKSESYQALKADTHLALGQIHQQKGNHSKAVENLFAALDDYQNLKDLVGQLKTQCLLAKEYEEIENLQPLEDLRVQIFQLYKNIEQPLTDPQIFMYLGALKSSTDADSAQWFFEQGLVQSENKPSSLASTSLYYLSGKLYFNQGKYTKAEEMLNNALGNLTKKNAPISKTKVLNLLAELATKQNKMDLAKNLIDSAYHEVLDLNQPDLYIETSTIRNKIYPPGKDRIHIIDSLESVLEKQKIEGTLKIISKAQSQESLAMQNQILGLEIKAKKNEIWLRYLWISLILSGGIVFFLIYRKVAEISAAKNDAIKVLLQRYENQLLANENVASQESHLEEAIIDFDQKITNLFEVKKVFLDSNLKVEQIASDLGMSYKQFSDLLKEHHKTNFKQYVNQYRIDYAKKLLLDPLYSHLSVEGIAKESGFGSKQGFYKVFQQIVGLKPNEFKNMKLD